MKYTTGASFSDFAIHYLYAEAKRRGMTPPFKNTFIAEMILIANKKWKATHR